MKNGLIEENGKLVYYEDDVPFHAGVIRLDGAIYYIGRGGIAVTGKHTVHSSMSNGILKHGIYTFGEDGKLVEGSYVALQQVTRRRRRSRHHRKSAPKKKFSLSKNTKKQLLILSGILLLALLLVGVSTLLDGGKNNFGASVQTTQGNVVTEAPNTTVAPTTTAAVTTVQEIQIKLPELAEEVVLVSSGALDAYYGKITIWEARMDGDPYKPFVFEYDLYGKDGVLSYSENEDFSSAVEVALDGSKTSLKIDNLKTGTQYYYKVTVEGKDYTGTFKTAASTRFVQVDGLYNARDIGGYTTQDGKTVKQGMIIRGAEYDGVVEPGYLLTKDSILYMQNTFGFAYDMDLREASLFAGEYVSYLGNQVRHEFYTAPQYGEIFNESAKDSLKRIFSDLADEANYPMYMHCTYGADRTGTIVFLLQGLLNMSEEEMVREYQRTGFFRSGYASSEKCDEIISGLAGQEGSSLQKKIVSFLLNDIGVTQAEIDSIRSILLQ